MGPQEKELPLIEQKPPEGLWQGDGSPAIKSQGPILTFHPEFTDKEKSYGAIWTQDHGLNGPTGEHYWTIKFGEFGPRLTALVGLSNRTQFKRGDACSGLFYGLEGITHAGVYDPKMAVTDYFGPAISSNDTIGILISFENSKLKVYFFYNGKPLGLAFKIAASTLSYVYPIVRFFGKKGSAEIQKGDVPAIRLPNPSERYTDIEGAWRMMEGNFVVKGEVTQWGENFDEVTLKICLCGDKYRLQLKIGDTQDNILTFNAKRTAKGWKMLRIMSRSMTGKSLIGPAKTVDRLIKDLCQEPRSATINGNTVKLMKGKAVATFGAFDDTPVPYMGNPFPEVKGKCKIHL